MTTGGAVVRSWRGVATTEDKSQAFAATAVRRSVAYLVYTGGEVATGIVLPTDRKASRHHATLHASPTGAVRVVDEQSRNGTWVNGERVADKVLADGDVVTIGDSLIVVRDEPTDAGDAEIAALIGHGLAMRTVRAAIARVAPTTATALVLAETGCGKELAARAIHDRSRAAGPFVAVNCAAIPDSLAESQLFGQLAGAFTGAVARPGLVRAADGGTLFLDEIGELSPAIQPKLLRFLQDRAVLPVGATASVACDVRVVAATNRDLRADVDRGSFRADLYARLAELPLRIPPLRERREDILALLRHALGASPPRLTPALAEAIVLHRFPFNVPRCRRWPRSCAWPLAPRCSICPTPASCCRRARSRPPSRPTRTTAAVAAAIATSRRIAPSSRRCCGRTRASSPTSRGRCSARASRSTAGSSSTASTSRRTDDGGASAVAHAEPERRALGRLVGAEIVDAEPQPRRRRHADHDLVVEAVARAAQAGAEPHRPPRPHVDAEADVDVAQRRAPRRAGGVERDAGAASEHHPPREARAEGEAQPGGELSVGRVVLRCRRRSAARRRSRR